MEKRDLIEVLINKVKIIGSRTNRKIVLKRLIQPQISIVKRYNSKEFQEVLGGKRVKYRETKVRVAIRNDRFYKIVQGVLVETRYESKNSKETKKVIKLPREEVEKVVKHIEYEEFTIVQDFKEDKEMRVKVTTTPS